MSPLIRRLVSHLRHIGSALHLEKRGLMAMVSERSREELEHLRQEYQQMPQDPDMDLQKFVSKK